MEKKKKKKEKETKIFEKNRCKGLNAIIKQYTSLKSIMKLCLVATPLDRYFLQLCHLFTTKITGLQLHKTFQLQRDCSSCKEFKHEIGIENATGRTCATRKKQKDLQQNFAVVELARKQEEEEEEEEENKETKEEEEEDCYYLLRRCTLLLVAFLRSLHGTDSRKQRHSLQ